MLTKGLLDVKIVDGGVNFYTFVHTHLIPHLQPFNGRNPHSEVILNNASIHHIQSVKKHSLNVEGCRDGNAKK